MIISFYVDYMLIFGTSMKAVIETKTYLASQLKMKDLGDVNTILGIKIKRHDKGYAFSQSHYIEKLVHNFSYLGF